MPKFKVRLESQTDSQAREVTLSARTKAEAQLICEEKERDYCAFQLPADDLAVIEKDHAVHSDGKVRGPVARSRGQLHAHYQSKPYAVVSVEKVGG
jgi:hypothetical protein